MKKLRTALTGYIIRRFANLPDIENEAEDIVNETFLKLWQSGKHELYFALFARVAVNTAIDRFRQQRGRLSLQDFSELQDEAERADIRLGKTELTADMLNAAVQNLKAEEETVIRLRYYRELSFTEIASEMKLKLNTVLSHHQRGIVKLRSHFTLLCPDYDYRLTDEFELDNIQRNYYELL